MPPRKSHPPHHRRGPDHAAPPAHGDEVLDQALLSLVPDAKDRAFVLRCMLHEGPPHHRGASHALLRLLAEAVRRAGGVPPELASRRHVPLRMRLPPHLSREHDDDHYALGLPVEALGEVLGSERERDAAIDALSDGPPHHALANAAMVWLLEALLERLSAASSSPGARDEGPSSR